jgi:hypothetical protein
MIPSTYSALGCIDFAEGQYESGEVLFENAKKTAIEVGKRDKDLMIAGYLYYLGNTALRRGHTKRAMYGNKFPSITEFTKLICAANSFLKH